MTASDLAAVVKGVAPAVLHVVSAKVGPIDQRVSGLEAKVASLRDGRDGAAGRDGKDAEPPDVEAIAKRAAELVPAPKDGRDAELPDVEAIAQKAAALIPAPKDGANGKDVDPALVESLKAEIVALKAQVAEQVAASELRSGDFIKEMREWLSEEVVKAVALIPVPKDGVDGKDGRHATEEDVAPLVAREVQQAVAALPVPKDGVDGASVDLAEVEAVVLKAVAALPVPTNGRDGQSVTVEDVAPLVVSEVEKAVKALPVPKDGVGVAGALIDKDGLLVLTLSDGTMKELGLVVGRDGERGEAGISGNPGANGKDGQNGTIENVQLVYDGERTVSFQFKDGTPVEGWSVKLPMLLDRGVYSSEKAYDTGDVVSYGGSGWIAKADSQGKQPGTNEGAPYWRLAVKRGNDGKVGPVGPQGDKGLRGEPGPMGPARY